MAESHDDPRATSCADEFSGWIAAARAGDQAALDQLARHVRGYLLLVANRELSPSLQRKIGPSDLVQETFVQLQKNLVQFRGSSEQELLAWVRRILINGIHDIHRRYRADMRDAAREQPLGGDSIEGLLPTDPASDTLFPDDAVIGARPSRHCIRRFSVCPTSIVKCCVCERGTDCPLRLSARV